MKDNKQIIDIAGKLSEKEVSKVILCATAHVLNDLALETNAVLAVLKNADINMDAQATNKALSELFSTSDLQTLADTLIRQGNNMANLGMCLADIKGTRKKDCISEKPKAIKDTKIGDVLYCWAQLSEQGADDEG